jgi:DNA polymerase-4
MARPSAGRTILHADLDAFYASVEQRDRPELRGKPVIVGSDGPRGVVATCSYEARKFGVHSALPGSIARRRCPQGIFVPPRMRVYVEIARQVRAIFESVTPLVEPLSLDEAFLDVTGSARLFGGGVSIAKKIRADVLAQTQLTISIGVASNKYCAKVASDLDKPDGLTIVPRGGEAEFLAPLPIRRLWGAGPKTQERLESLGLHTIGEVATCEEKRLRRVLGEEGTAHFKRLALGLDDRSVAPSQAPKSISHEQTFGHDLEGDDAAHAVLLALSESVGMRARAQGLQGKVVTVKCRFPPFETHTRQQHLPEPSFDDLVLYRTGCELLTRMPQADRPKRLLGIGISDLVPEGQGRQLGLFDEEERAKSERVLRALDRIREKHGKDALEHGREDPRKGDDAPDPGDWAREERE